GGALHDPGCNTLRRPQQRTFLAPLFLSPGVPMLLGGDELSRTQYGNNNAWCQDNEVSWFDWETAVDQQELLEFTQRLILMRRHHPVFRRRYFLRGTSVDGSGLPDVWWFRPDGRRMTRREWDDGGRRATRRFRTGAGSPP